MKVKEKEEDDNDDYDEPQESYSNDSECSAQSVTTLATNVRYNVKRNVRVMFYYTEETTKWCMKNQNILEHEVVIQLQNMKAVSDTIGPTINYYEWTPDQHLHIFEGEAMVRSRNRTGWSDYKRTKFKLDEDGIPID